MSVAANDTTVKGMQVILNSGRCGSLACRLRATFPFVTIRRTKEHLPVTWCADATVHHTIQTRFTQPTGCCGMILLASVTDNHDTCDRRAFDLYLSHVYSDVYVTFFFSHMHVPKCYVYLPRYVHVSTHYIEAL